MLRVEPQDVQIYDQKSNELVCFDHREEMRAKMQMEIVENISSIMETLKSDNRYNPLATYDFSITNNRITFTPVDGGTSIELAFTYGNNLQEHAETVMEKVNKSWEDH